MNKIKIKAPAKINLFLDVTKRCKNGYHEIKTIFQAIDLFDKIIIKKAKNLKVITNIKELNKEKNIAEKAFELLDKKYMLASKVHIKIEKNIPMGAGLGGGSSDAAAVISGLNKLFELNLSLEDMLDLGKELGADVNFFINRSGIQYGEHYGEKLTPLKFRGNYYIILIYPDIHISTKDNYKKLKPSDFNNGEIHLKNMLSAIRKKNVDKLISNIYNIFEKGTVKLYPIIKEVKEDLSARGVENALMSGSGSAVYGLIRDRIKAKKILKILKKKYKKIYLVKPYYDGVQIV